MSVGVWNGLCCSGRACVYVGLLRVVELVLCVCCSVVMCCCALFGDMWLCVVRFVACCCVVWFDV